MGMTLETMAMNVPMHRLHIHYPGRIMKTLFGLIVGTWSSLAVADERSLIIQPGREFSADSYVHKPLINDAPLDPQSRSYAANLQRQIKKYYGHPDVSIDGGTPAIYIVPIDQPTVRVKYVAWDRPGETVRPLQAQWETVPLPEDFLPTTGDESEAVVYQPSTGKMWEFWRVRKTGAKVVNSAGRVWMNGGQIGADAWTILPPTLAIG